MSAFPGTVCPAFEIVLWFTAQLPTTSTTATVLTTATATATTTTSSTSSSSSQELGNDCDLQTAWGVDALSSAPIGDMVITYFPDAREVALKPAGTSALRPILQNISKGG